MDLIEMPLTASEKADRFGSAPRRLQNVKILRKLEKSPPGMSGDLESGFDGRLRSGE